MSAAATAAGYLYASGRLRGRNGRENEGQDSEHQRDNERHYGDERARETRKPVKVAVYQPAPQQTAPLAPKKTPKIQYRTRRWRPE
jgi:hypothetical protein